MTDIRVVEMINGSNCPPADRLRAGLQLSVANAAGTGGAPVTTAVTFPAGALPASYAVVVDPGQAVLASVANKTATGFSVSLTPLNGNVAAGSFNVLLFG